MGLRVHVFPCVRESAGLRVTIEDVKGGCQQLEVMGDSVSVDVCNVILISLKESLIEVTRQMAHIHYSMMA